MEGGGTLQEWGGRRAVMEALPTMDCYEDMFKEITRKLYGEDGLQDMDTEHGILRPSDCESDPPDGHGALAAFGLAALMQNGFPPPHGMFAHHHHISESNKGRSGEDKWVVSEECLQWTSSKIATYNAAQRLFRCTECECVGFLSRVAEHWLGTHANLRVFQCPSCPYASAWARCVRMHLQRQHNVADPGDSNSNLWKENPVLEEVTKYLQRLKNRVESPATPPAPILKTEFTPPSQPQQSSPLSRPVTTQPSGSENTPSKRYSCTFCPYATDRRDLFTRHENIHRDEKPFQCYVCQKQFNRADHVKKHFLRMHRDHPYDLNRIRRQTSKQSNGIAYYDNKYVPHSVPPHRPQTLTPQGQIHHGLNIPSGFPPPPSSIRGLKPSLSSPKIINGCNAKSHGSKNGKKKGEKRYSCCYCTWSGVDNWCLKRHLNTHLKPFTCALCDYKAARSERLATHVLKVHNKRACSRCSFLGDDSAQLALHVQEHHPLDQRNNRSQGHVLRAANPPNNNNNNNNSNHNNNNNSHLITSSFCSHEGVSTNNHRRYYDEPSGGIWAPHNHLSAAYQIPEENWKSNKHFGAARLFHYMEASDNSEPENDPEEEPPPFICRECGCEFVDDTSLETHVFTHHRSVKEELTKPLDKYAKYCSSETKEDQQLSKHPRKQEEPKKVSKSCDVQVVRTLKDRRSHPSDGLSKIRIKQLSELILRRGRRCWSCQPKKQVTFPYHTAASLALHRAWRHRPDRFRCEHCPASFRHRYHLVLHAGRDHVPRTTPNPDQENTFVRRTEPESLNIIPNFLTSLHELQPGYRCNLSFPISRTLQELHTNKPFAIRYETEDVKLKCLDTDVVTSYKVVDLTGSSSDLPFYTDPPAPAPVPLVVPSYPPSVSSLI